MNHSHIVLFTFFLLTREGKPAIGIGGGGNQKRAGHSQKNWVGLCGPLPETLTLSVTFPTLFMT